MEIFLLFVISIAFPLINKDITFMDIIMYAKTIQLSFKKHCKLNRFNAPTAVTLTMKQAILTGSGHWISLDRLIAEANFRHFSNRLNKACFGNAFCRFDKRLRTIPILESSAMQRLHYHCVLDHPSSIDETEFRCNIEKCWNATTCENAGAIIHH